MGLTVGNVSTRRPGLLLPTCQERVNDRPATTSITPSARQTEASGAHPRPILASRPLDRQRPTRTRIGDPQRGGRPATGGSVDHGKLIHASVVFQAYVGTITEWGLWYSTAVRASATCWTRTSRTRRRVWPVSATSSAMRTRNPVTSTTFRLGGSTTGTSRRASTPV